MNDRIKHALSLLPPGRLEVTASGGNAVVEEDSSFEEGHYSVAGAPSVDLPSRYAGDFIPKGLYKNVHNE
jgi:hypothetical protein